MKFVLVLLVCVASGVVGFLFGNDHSIKTAAVEQVKQNAADFDVGKHDMTVRVAEKTKSGIAANVIYRDRTILVPHKVECSVTKGVMAKLNDPDLVGAAQ